MNDTETPLTTYQWQTVLGTLLGTSSIIRPKAGRNAFLQMREKKSGDLNWLRCKAGILQGCGRPHAFMEDKDSWHWASAANPTWNKFADLCYQGGRKVISREWLDPLTDTAWATWFLDKGLKDGKQAYLRTSYFGKDGNDLIAVYLSESGFDCVVELKRGVRRIAFTEESTERYMRLILPRFPKYLLDALSSPT